MNAGYIYCPYIPVYKTPIVEKNMSDTTILRENNPETAQFVEAWRAKYQRAYDFTDEVEQANYYEGVVEMARHIATSGGSASLSAEVSTKGVSEVRSLASPYTNED